MRLVVGLLSLGGPLIDLVKCSTGDSSGDDSFMSATSSDEKYYTAQSSDETDDTWSSNGDIDDTDGGSTESDTCPRRYPTGIFTASNVKTAKKKNGAQLCTFNPVDAGSLDSLSFEILPDKTVALFSSYCPVKESFDLELDKCVEGPFFRRNNGKCILQQIDNLHNSPGMTSLNTLSRELLPSESYLDLTRISDDRLDSSGSSSGSPSGTEQDQTDGLRLSKRFKSLRRKNGPSTRSANVEQTKPTVTLPYKADTSSKSCESVFIYIEYALRCTMPTYGQSLIGLNNDQIRRRFLNQFCSSVLFRK